MQMVNISLRNMSLLPRLCLLLSAALGIVLPALAENPKFATVDVSLAFESYHLTVVEKAKIKTARETLRQDPRHEILKLLQVDLRELKDQTRNPTLTEKERKEFYRRYMMKNYERVSLRRERDEHLAEQLKLINESMVKKTYDLLGNVRAIVQKIADGKGFDFVFEKSGKTSSQLAPLIYIRNSTDITELVIKELNKNKPVEKDVAATVNP